MSMFMPSENARVMPTDRSMWLWSVDGVGVNPEGRVYRGPSDGEIPQDFGPLCNLVEENRLLREHVAERNAIIEAVSKECGGLKTENETLKIEIERLRSKPRRFGDYAETHANMAAGKATAKRPPITTAEMRDQMRETEWAYEYGTGYVAPPTVEINGTLQASPLRCGGIHLDAPAGSIITITLPKD